MDWFKAAVVAALLLLPSLGQADDYRVLHFGATWCRPCRVLNQRLEHPEIQALVKKHKLRLMDIDTDQDHVGVANYQVTDIPVCLLVRINAQNKAVVLRRVTGLQTHEQLLVFLLPPGKG